MTLAQQIKVTHYCREIGLPPPEYEYGRAIPLRRHRIDCAWVDKRVGLEIDGSITTGGRHGGTPSALRDLWKRNTLTSLGWLVIHVAPHQLFAQDTWMWLRTLLT